MEQYIVLTFSQAVGFGCWSWGLATCGMAMEVGCCKGRLGHGSGTWLPGGLAAVGVGAGRGGGLGYRVLHILAWPHAVRMAQYLLSFLIGISTWYKIS